MSEDNKQPISPAPAGGNSWLADLRALENEANDKADRCYHSGDINGGYGQRCRAIGINEAIKALEKATEGTKP